MRVYGNEFEIGGKTSWYAEDGSGDSYELQEFPSRDGSLITYTVTKTDIHGTRTSLKPLRWSVARKLHVPPQQKAEGSGNTNGERHDMSQKVMIDNYVALQTAVLPIQPYVRPDSNETVDIHDEFERMVAYAVDHRSYEHPFDNYQSVSFLRIAQRIDKTANMRDWRVSPNAPHPDPSDASQDSTAE